MRFAAAFSILALLFVGTIYFYIPIRGDDFRAIELKNHSAAQIDSWSEILGKNLSERIGIDPSFALEFVSLDISLQDNRSGYIYTKSNIGYSQETGRLREDAILAIESLPVSVRNLMEEHLLGVLFVENLGATGVCYVVPGHWRKTWGFIAIDAQEVNKPINQWYSSRVKSAFSGESNFMLETILDEEENTRISTLRFILLHEFGHIWAVSKGLEPPYYSGADRMSYDFIKNSWVYPGRSIYDDEFPGRMYLKFYSGGTSLLSQDAMLRAYQDLQKTNFISLYGATSNSEDIAELFTFYVHCILLNKPHIVRIYQNENLAFEMKNPIFNSKFRRKIQVIEKNL